MDRTYYHATRKLNFESIMNDGVIYTGIDHIVYLAENLEDAYKFIRVRVGNEPIVIFEITDLDPNKIKETFDHSYKFFQCKSYGYSEDIPIDKISKYFTVDPE